MLTILFAPLDYHGHVNACHGLAEVLRDRGHTVVFAVDKVFQSKLESYGYGVEPTSLSEGSAVDMVSQIVLDNMDIFERGSLAMAEGFQIFGFGEMLKALRAKDEQYKTILAKVKPDLIVIDSYVGSPTLTDSGIPWVWLFSAAPLLALNNHSLPPPWSGLPTNGDREEWAKFRSELERLYLGLHKQVNEWYREAGAPPLPDYPCVTHPISPHLNIYTTPEELDYRQVQPLPHNWHRTDGSVRTTNESFAIPECLSDRLGKLVFLSMGSMGCSHLNLMKRLVAILAKSQHKFIVCTGPIGDRYELADNMWGQAFVPQTAVLPLVDLVITHGGNNTVTETFFYGKPMLVMPLFGDQYENAQRIQEESLGLRLDPFHCTEDQLLSAVDRLVTDEGLRDRMAAIGRRIRTSNDKEVIAQLLEGLIN